MYININSAILIVIKVFDYDVLKKHLSMTSMISSSLSKDFVYCFVYQYFLFSPLKNVLILFPWNCLQSF